MSSLILGLGNPGSQYSGSRHNVGFRVVAELARRWGVAVDRLECNSLVGEARDAESCRQDSALLAMPQTYMNRSGFAARCLLEVHNLAPERVLVVYDEVHLPLGRLRLRRAGSPAGHRGMESVIENLRSAEVPRLRLGIAGEAALGGEDLADYVLGQFRQDEEEMVAEMVARAAEVCELWRCEGIEAAMQRFNG